jgi:hypothetical protein
MMALLRTGYPTASADGSGVVQVAAWSEHCDLVSRQPVARLLVMGSAAKEDDRKHFDVFAHPHDIVDRVLVDEGLSTERDCRLFGAEHPFASLAAVHGPAPVKVTVHEAHEIGYLAGETWLHDPQNRPAAQPIPAEAA